MKAEGSGAAALIDTFALVVDSYTFCMLCLIVTLFTGLIIGIEVFGKTKVSLVACLNLSTFLYLLILLVGNVIAATLFLIPYAENAVNGTHMSGYALIAAFVGVFSFKGVLSNTNITMFNKGVLTIADWMGKAGDNAVASSLAKDVQMKDQQIMLSAQNLNNLPEAELNTHINHALGNGKVLEFDAEAATAHADPRYYKALKLATLCPDYVKTVKKLPPNGAINGVK